MPKLMEGPAGARTQRGECSVNDRDSSSYLPQPIIQDILLSLPPKVMAQMSVLSKEWNNAYNTLPVLEFNEEIFPGKYPNDDWSNDPFMEYVDAYITRRSEDDHSILKLSLEFYPKGHLLRSVVPEWIQIASAHGLKELVLRRIIPAYPDVLYMEVGPDLISNTITTLHISDLYMRELEIRLPHLRQLTLRGVDASDDTFNGIMSNCPLLQRVKLVGCSSFGRLNVKGEKLKSLGFWKACYVRSIKFNAPNLTTFAYSGYQSYPEICLGDWSSLCFESTKLVKDLTLDVGKTGIRTVRQVISHLPILENLSLNGSKGIKRIKISHACLKHMALIDFVSLSKIKIKTPNLVSFKYSGKIPGTGAQNPAKLDNAMIVVDFKVWTMRSFFHACKFLKYFGCCKSLELFCNTVEALVLPEQIRDGILPLLPNVKHLKLHLRNIPEIESSALEECLLWMSPTVETLHIFSPVNSIIAERLLRPNRAL